MSKGKSWFNAKAAGNGVGVIRIFNDIGDFGLTASDFASELDGLGDVKTLDVSISSNGGDVSTGFAIFNMLNRHKARKVVTVEGLAASMASVIAMVGDEVRMPSNAMMMIHNPWGVTMGGADEMISFGEALQTMQDNIADAYVARTGMDRDEVLALMARETWLSAKRAVELGFADTVEDSLQIAAAFDLSRFNHVPKKFADANRRISTMAKAPKHEAADDESESAESKGAVKTEAQIRADVLAHAREVRSLCNLTGFPKMADKFIEDNTSLSDVIVALDAAKAKAADKGKGKDKDKSDEIDAHNTGRGDNSKPAAEINPREIFARWNSAGQHKD